MKKLLLITALLTGAVGCQTLKTANDAREALCDILGDEQRAALDAEAKRVGMSPADIYKIWKESCRVRIVAAEKESVGAIGSTGSAK